ncbi:ABC transporter substrate-binding protein [Rhodococcus rhodochrous]|uniref:ABC transporter substrate-binding protein n=1 Tax=Rhodococcus rhodochrous TaxID=1829 RepID=A0AAW4XF78_RHORH|nr:MULTISPECIES: ABC transporter substrate-binding protein [Rhodococcus]MCD2111754.1 ABC transporter substrate-binding protein [Rhodococcus rhodochrous]WAL45899.1 ABC transporter substrate-binding protein [Rhodococcus pyridinivorans]
MFGKRHLAKGFAAACAGVLLLSGCGGGDTADANETTAAGDPVAGGELVALQLSEPRTLDPGGLSNTWAHHPIVGNALYGTLMTNDPTTLEVEYGLATGFTTDDGGRTFTLTLRPDVTFTDGTPFDAAAVEFNWRRIADPATGSSGIRQAAQITGYEVVDPGTLTITLAEPNPHFAQGVIANALNWIASPTALQKGQAEFDANPVGAGPFTLVNWTRQAEMTFEKNPDYWDAPKPYLDRLVVRGVSDGPQRINAVTTGAADLSLEANWSNLAKADAAGLQTVVTEVGGGQTLALNLRRAPFDDERARRAVALALDLDGLNSVVYNGDGVVPTSLFAEGSPLYTDVEWPTANAEEAQKLFDELSAEGKPVSFTFLSYPTTDTRTTGETIQAQLSAFDNVDVQVEVLDYAQVTARSNARDFDMMVSSAAVQDPDYTLWTAFHSRSPGNFTGVADPELDAALDRGRLSESTDERKDVYAEAEQRIVELTPAIFYIAAAPSLMASPDVQGIEMYTLGSLRPEEIWIED